MSSVSFSFFLLWVIFLFFFKSTPCTNNPKPQHDDDDDDDFRNIKPRPGSFAEKNKTYFLTCLQKQKVTVVMRRSKGYVLYYIIKLFLFLKSPVFKFKITFLSIFILIRLLIIFFQNVSLHTARLGQAQQHGVAAYQNSRAGCQNGKHHQTRI